MKARNVVAVLAGLAVAAASTAVAALTPPAGLGTPPVGPSAFEPTRAAGSADTVTFGGGGLEPLVPARVLDTRNGIGAPTARVGAGATLQLQITGRGGVPATGVGAVVLNVTAVNPTANTFITVWPTGAPRPNASNLNVRTNTTVPNLVIAKVGTNGRVSLYNEAGTTNLLADVVGWFPTGSQSTTTMRLAPGTVLAGAGDVVSYTGSSDTGGTVRLSASADVPLVGGRLAVAPHSRVPQGLAGQVTARSFNADGTHSLSFVPTTLQALFLDLRVDADTLDPSPWAAAQGPPVRQALNCATGVGVGLAMPTFTLGDFDGDISFDLTGKRLRLTIDATARVEWLVNTSASFSCSFPLPRLPLGFLGPVLVEAGVEVDVEVSAAVNGMLWAEAPIRIGVEYDDGDLNNLSSFSSDGGVEVESLSVSATVSAGVETAVKLFGIAGLTFSHGPEIDLTVSADCVELTAGYRLALGAEVGRWGVGWSFEIGDYVLGTLTLFESDGCEPVTDGPGWTGTILHTYSVLIEPVGGGPGSSTRQATVHYQLMTDGVVTNAGETSVSAIVSGAGSYFLQETAECDGDLLTDTDLRTYEITWQLENGQRWSAITFHEEEIDPASTFDELDGEEVRVTFRPVNIAPWEWVGDVGSGTAEQEVSCVPGGLISQETLSQYDAESWQSQYLSPPAELYLVDEDGDPDRFAGVAYGTLEAVDWPDANESYTITYTVEFDLVRNPG